MNKKRILAMLTLSTVVLSTNAVFADENTTTSNESIVRSVLQADGTVTTTEATSKVSPDESVTQEEPLTLDTTNNETTGTTTVDPVDPTIPIDPIIPAEPTEPIEPPTTVDPVDPTVPTEPSTPETPEPSEKPTTPGTSDPSTPVEEAPADPTPIPKPSDPFNPFETPSGQTVVGLQNSKVIIQQADGSTQTVKAEEVGGTTNADSTVTLKTASGEVKTLPQTGEEAGGLFSLLGTVILTGLGFLKKKKIV